MGQTVEVILKAKAILGEGPLWCLKRNRLYWVDILTQTVNNFNPDTSENVAFNIGQDVGAIVPRSSGGFMLAVRDGFAGFEPETGDVDMIYCQKRTGIRFNDGKCDPAGRFWAGTMVEGTAVVSGALYCLDTDLTVRTMIPDVGVSNGLVWSSDYKKFYYIDSPTNQVVSYDYDLESGNITDCQVAIEIDKQMGMPDGMAINEEDMVYIALWKGGIVARFNPKSGKLIEKYQVPYANLVTSCTFGGDNLDELYITTASTGLTASELKDQKYAGSLFKIKLDIKGTPAFEFKG